MSRLINKVWLRYFGIDFFIAECRVLRPGNKRTRRITAAGPTIEECLNNLAFNVADYLCPRKDVARGT